MLSLNSCPCHSFLCSLECAVPPKGRKEHTVNVGGTKNHNDLYGKY